MQEETTLARRLTYLCDSITLALRPTITSFNVLLEPPRLALKVWPRHRCELETFRVTLLLLIILVKERLRSNTTSQQLATNTLPLKLPMRQATRPDCSSLKNMQGNGGQLVPQLLVLILSLLVVTS